MTVTFALCSSINALILRKDAFPPKPIKAGKGASSTARWFFQNFGIIQSVQKKMLFCRWTNTRIDAFRAFKERIRILTCSIVMGTVKCALKENGSPPAENKDRAEGFGVITSWKNLLTIFLL